MITVYSDCQLKHCYYKCSNYGFLKTKIRVESKGRKVFFYVIIIMISSCFYLADLSGKVTIKSSGAVMTLVTVCGCDRSTRQ